MYLSAEMKSPVKSLYTPVTVLSFSGAMRKYELKSYDTSSVASDVELSVLVRWFGWSHITTTPKEGPKISP